jgi:hypothetical protein
VRPTFWKNPNSSLAQQLFLYRVKHIRLVDPRNDLKLQPLKDWNLLLHNYLRIADNLHHIVLLIPDDQDTAGLDFPDKLGIFTIDTVLADRCCNCPDSGELEVLWALDGYGVQLFREVSDHGFF